MYKIHVEVFIAAKVLENRQGTFSIAALKHFIKQEFGDERPGVTTHVTAHCVANAPLNATPGYNYLWRLPRNELRSFHPGNDTPVAARRDLAWQPKTADVPATYRYLLKG